MDHAIYRDDISHIILDNLQFMMLRENSRSSGNSINSSFDKFESQDAIIELFRKFATEKNVRIGRIYFSLNLYSTFVHFYAFYLYCVL